MSEGIMLVSDRPTEAHEQFLLEAMTELRNHKVQWLGLIAGLEGDNEAMAMTGWHNATLGDKQMAAAQIQADVTIDLIRVNLPDLLADAENGEEEPWDTEEDY